MIFLLKSLLREFFMSGSHSNQHIYHAVCVPYLIQITKFLLSEKFKYRTNLTGKDLTLLTIIRNPHEDFFALPKIPRVTCLVYMTMTRARDVGRDSLVSRAHSYEDIHMETHTSTDSPAWFRRGSPRKTDIETDLTSSKWLVCIGSADWRPWLKCNRMRSRWSDLKGKLLVSTKNCNELLQIAPIWSKFWVFFRLLYLEH